MQLGESRSGSRKGDRVTLLDDIALHASPVVANCRMNRERRLGGANSYQRDLGLDLREFLLRASSNQPVIWLDLCCGTGRALVEAAEAFIGRRPESAIRIEGIDLAGLFDANPYPDVLRLTEQSIEGWKAAGPYHLITCVHGLHYVGDKLGALAKAASCLATDGELLAHLDLANFWFPDGRAAGRTVAARLRREGFAYETRRRIVRCTGPRQAAFDLRYLGADDTAGPNFTGQPAVNSWYEMTVE